MQRRSVFICRATMVLIAIFQSAQLVAAADMPLQREHDQQHLELMLQQLQEQQRHGELSQEDRQLLEALAEQQQIKLRILQKHQQAERAWQDLRREQAPTVAIPPPDDSPQQQQAHQFEQQQQQLQFRIQQQLQRSRP